MGFLIGRGRYAREAYPTPAVSGGGGGGITQLHQDVVAGPGTGDVPATVEGFQTRPVDPGAPPNDSSVYVWNGSEWVARQLTADDIAAGFSITGFSGGSTVETGATVTNPSFTASYSSLPTSAAITNTDGQDSPHNLTTPFTSATDHGRVHALDAGFHYVHADRAPGRPREDCDAGDQLRRPRLRRHRRRGRNELYRSGE